MPRTRPAYPAEYKAELVRLVREEGRTTSLALARRVRADGASRSRRGSPGPRSMAAPVRDSRADEKAELKRAPMQRCGC